MAKRPKFSRWRRNPGTYRFGEQTPPDPDEELQRVTLYIPGSYFDLAETQALRFGFPSSQEYCTDLVLKAIQAERIKERVAEAETRLGPFEGLHEIADDPAYLADLLDAAHPRNQGVEASRHLPDPNDHGIVWADDPTSSTFENSVDLPQATGSADRPMMSLSASAKIVLRHAAQAEYDPSAFLPTLRRGEPVPPVEVAELAQALHALEIEYRTTRSMDRRLAFSLHRLAYESQILHTDAFPAAFDIWTVEMIRAVQEAVERILSGQDIRYEAPRTLQNPELPTPYPRELPR